MTIGDRIRRIRKKRRLTQAELAMMSGLSLSAIQGYEHGRYEPKRKSLESIAEVFKIPVDELYDMPVQLGTNLAEVGTDCISRQAAIDDIWTVSPLARLDRKWIDRWLKQLPPIQPEIVRCKDCKHWKDSDGVFRRGIGVESKCPLNLHQVYEGTFYCGLGERREVTT